MTPPAPGAIATIRLEGPAASAILNAIFRPSAAPERPCYGALYDSDGLLDHTIVATDTTGCDFHVHGGPRVVQRVLMLLQNHGVQMVPWQDLLPDDSIANEIQRWLPHALTPLAAKAIAAQHPRHPAGLAATAATATTAIRQIVDDPAAMGHCLAELAATFSLGRVLLTEPLVVLAGPVNAGKSTLANALTGHDQSLAADLPGTTRDWTEHPADCCGLAVRLVDTAGRREPADELEQRALELAQDKLEQADLVVLVVEAGHVIPKLQHDLLVANKIDLHPDTALPTDAIRVSALSGHGLDALRAAIAAHFGLSPQFDPRSPLVFTTRQHRLLTAAAEALGRNDLESARRLLLSLLGE